jgi:pimeloyl-ACP methyl ester carboxylesterase
MVNHQGKTSWITLLTFNVFCLTLWPIALYGENSISVHDIPTRPGVTVSVLLVKPEQPVATILLLPGGVGRISFQPDGSTGYSGFPVRKPALFAEQGLAAAVIKPPTDRLPNPAMTFFRTSEAHAEDLRYVIAVLRKETGVPVWLVGHSNGTTSAANAAIRIRGGAPDGIVLISSKVGKRDQWDPVLDFIDVEQITVPTLVVHHELDECEFTLFRNTPSLMARLKKATKAELISFKGGGPVQGDACRSLHYHGFPGIEQEVTSRIADWIKSTLKR